MDDHHDHTPYSSRPAWYSPYDENTHAAPSPALAPLPHPSTYKQIDTDAPYLDLKSPDSTKPSNSSIHNTVPKDGLHSIHMLSLLYDPPVEVFTPQHAIHHTCTNMFCASQWCCSACLSVTLRILTCISLLVLLLLKLLPLAISR